MVRTIYAKQEFFVPGHVSKMIMSANLGTKCFKSFFEKIFLDKF